MRSRPCFPLLVLALLGAPGCAEQSMPGEQLPSARTDDAAATPEFATQPADTDERAAILALLGDLLAAYEARDLEGLLALYTDDAVRMPPDQPIQDSRQKIRSDLVRTLSSGPLEITLHLHETELAGDLAYTRGTWSRIQHYDDGRPSQEDVGTWVFMLRRQSDGGWKIARSIWNSDVPS